MTNTTLRSLAGLFCFGTVLAVSGCTTVPDASASATATAAGPHEHSKLMTAAKTDQTDTAGMKAECMAMRTEMKAKMKAKMQSGEMGMKDDGMMTPEKKAAMQAKHEKHMKCMELMPEMKAEMQAKCMQTHEGGMKDHCKMMQPATPAELGEKQ